jgi:hypothetical protein
MMDAANAPVPDIGSHRIFHASKAKWRTVLLVGLAFVAIGLIMIVTKGDFLAWFITLAFAVVAGVALLQINGSGLRLVLDADTFTSTSIGRAATTERWDRCADFTVYRVSDSEQVVYDTARNADTHIGEMNRSLTGRSASLPDTFDMPAQDLANLMNAYQAAAIERSWQHHADAITSYESVIADQLKSSDTSAQIITDSDAMDLPADMSPWPAILVIAAKPRPDGARHILQVIDVLSPASVWIHDDTKKEQAFDLLGADELQIVDPAANDDRRYFPHAH